jgi:hypothetical protein
MRATATIMVVVISKECIGLELACCGHSRNQIEPAA